MKNLVGEERKRFILANSVILLVAGSDDIANTYYDIRARPQYDVDSYTTLMANSASSFVTVSFSSVLNKFVYTLSSKALIVGVGCKIGYRLYTIFREYI